jgi:hypothetical protein
LEGREAGLGKGDEARDTRVDVDVEMAAREACEGDRMEDLETFEEAEKKRPDVQEERNAKGAELVPREQNRVGREWEGSGKEERCCWCCGAARACVG